MTGDQFFCMGARIRALEDELSCRRGRLANAIRIGRPAHIAHVRARVEGIEARLSAMAAEEES